MIQSAGTVLRTVMLFKSLESFVRTSELWAVERAFHGIFCNWDSWRWYVLRVERKFEAIGLKLWVDYACWLFCDVFPRWREAVLLRKFVRRMQRVVADMTVRGATRQWLAKFKVYRLWAVTQHCRWNTVVWSLCELMGI